MGTAFDEWKSLFSYSSEMVWMQEIKELRKFAMLIHVLGTEMTRMQILAENQLKTYQQQFKQRQSKCSSNKPVGCTPLMSAMSKANSSKQSYVSPDIFDTDSPLSATMDSKLNENVTEMNTDDDEDVIQTQKTESPRLNGKSKRFLQLRRFRRTKTPTKQKLFVDDIVENTPDLGKSRIRSQTRKKRNETFHNITTQKHESVTEKVELMEPSEEKLDESDIEPTVYGDFVEESMKVDDIIEMVHNADVTNCTLQEPKTDLKKLSRKGGTNHGTKSPTKCRACDNPRRYCAKHDSQNYTLAEQTFTGLWDIDFTVKSPDVHSQKSTIYFCN